MNYKTLTKEELIEEIKARRSNGSKIAVDLRSAEPVLIAALENDDLGKAIAEEAKASAPAQIPPTLPAVALETPPPVVAEPPVKATPLASQIPLEPEMPSQATQPHPDVFEAGFLARNKADGYIYQVALVGSDALKPYKCRVPKQASGHPGLFWEGNEDEFTALFSKV